MQNNLERYIYENSLNEREVMNQLNDAAIISDNCVCAADVCTGDALKSVSWLLAEKGELAL